jgi:putative thioredoxin
MGNQWIEDTTTADFAEKVLERSREVPVLVDFWAPWCGPCHALGPLLEAAVAERGGAVRLCKLNTDEDQELAQRFGIRGIPAVKAFVDGAMVDEFVGLLDRAGIESFLDRVVPSGASKALTEAKQALAAGDHGSVAALLEPLLDDREHGERAQLLTAQAAAAMGDFASARAALGEIAEDGELGQAAQALGQRVELLEVATQEPDEAGATAALEANADDRDARFALAARQYARGAHGEALDSLLELLARGRDFRDDGARRALLAIFDELGPESDLVGQTRRRMQIYL